MKIEHAEPKSPRACSPEIPEELEKICLKCLCKKVDQRYLSATDLGKALRKLPGATARCARSGLHRRPAIC